MLQASSLGSSGTETFHTHTHTKLRTLFQCWHHLRVAEYGEKKKSFVVPYACANHCSHLHRHCCAELWTTLPDYLGRPLLKGLAVPTLVSSVQTQVKTTSSSLEFDSTKRCCCCCCCCCGCRSRPSCKRPRLGSLTQVERRRQKLR